MPLHFFDHRFFCVLLLVGRRPFPVHEATPELAVHNMSLTERLTKGVNYKAKQVSRPEAVKQSRSKAALSQFTKGIPRRRRVPNAGVHCAEQIGTTTRRGHSATRG